MDSSSRLTVALRIRPLDKLEVEQNAVKVAFRTGEKSVALTDPDATSDDFLRQNRAKERKFVFDAAFDVKTSQDEVHRLTTKPLIEHVVNGRNATVFAYGATGSGKTYTMLGNRRNVGIMTRVASDLYGAIEKIRTATFIVKMSYLEVYNENIRDLLDPRSGMLELWEDAGGAIRVPGLSERTIGSAQEILSILHAGNERRTQEPTGANLTSSRSHAVLQFCVTRVEHDGLKNETGRKNGKLFLIDLAGSERASHTNNRGQRMKEGASINRSLLALGNVINSLSDNDHASKYVNYRDSKLTRLLKDSLGGDSRTVMIAHISAASTRYEETKHTLIYADRAKRITRKVSHSVERKAQAAVPPLTVAITKPTAATVPIMLPGGKLKHIAGSQYYTIIQELRREIARLRTTVKTQRQQHKGNGYGNKVKKQAASPRGGPTKEQQDEFGQRKAELIKCFDSDYEIRRQLKELNRKAFETATTLSAKAAILDAWIKKRLEGSRHTESTIISELEEPQPVSKLRTEVAMLEDKLNRIREQHVRLENQLDGSDRRLLRLRAAAQQSAMGASQKELLELLWTMYQTDVDKIAIETDHLLVTARDDRLNHSLKKINSFGVVSEKLVNQQQQILKDSNVLVPSEVNDLYKEYKMLKNQVSMHMISLTSPVVETSTTSWNRQRLERRKSESSPNTEKLYTTMSKGELERLKSDLQSRQPHNSQSPEKQTSPEEVVSLPPIEQDRYSTGDDVEVSYRMVRRPNSKPVSVQSEEANDAASDMITLPNTPLKPGINVNPPKIQIIPCSAKVTPSRIPTTIPKEDQV